MWKGWGAGPNKSNPRPKRQNRKRRTHLVVPLQRLPPQMMEAPQALPQRLKRAVHERRRRHDRAQQRGHVRWVGPPRPAAEHGRRQPPQGRGGAGGAADADGGRAEGEQARGLPAHGGGGNCGGGGGCPAAAGGGAGGGGVGGVCVCDGVLGIVVRVEVVVVLPVFGGGFQVCVSGFVVCSYVCVGGGMLCVSQQLSRRRPPHDPKNPPTTHFTNAPDQVLARRHRRQEDAVRVPLDVGGLEVGADEDGLRLPRARAGEVLCLFRWCMCCVVHGGLSLGLV